MPTLYLAITNHGFGHATRASSVVATILEKFPELHVIVATTAPQWLLQSYLQDIPAAAQVTFRTKSFDIGILQSDSLTMDTATTLDKLHWIRTHQDDILKDEIEFLKREKVDLILGDIPPLVTRLAQAVGIPCWMMSNFGWDFIYRPWGGEFEAIADWIADCFSQCQQLFRLPFHEPMSAFPKVIDVGMTGGKPRYSTEQLRQRYNITTPIEKTVLLTFGGLGLAQIPYETINKFPDWQFITFDRNAPDLPNLLDVNDQTLRPVDFMPLCERVVSKPGYSTFAEACGLHKGIVSIPREGFAEADLLLNGIQDYCQHQILDTEAFFDGDWSFLTEPLQSPKTEVKLPLNGNVAIAQAVLDYLRQ